MIKQSLGLRIKSLREELNLSQLDLANKLNIGNSTLSQYESDKRVPSDDIKRKLADFFNVSLDYLMGVSDKRNIIDTEDTRIERYQSNLDLDITDDIKSLMNKLNYAIHFSNIKHIILDNEELSPSAASFLRFALEVAIKQIKSMNLKELNDLDQNPKINLNKNLKNLTTTEGMTKQDWEAIIGITTSSLPNSIYLSNSTELLKYIGDEKVVNDLYNYALESLNIKNLSMHNVSTKVQLNFLLAVLDDINIDKVTGNCHLTFKHELGSSNYTNS